MFPPPGALQHDVFPLRAFPCLTLGWWLSAGAVQPVQSQGGRLQPAAGQGEADAAQPRRLRLRLEDGAERGPAGAEMVSGQHQDGGEKGNVEEKMHPALPRGLTAAAPCLPTLLSHTKLGVGFLGVFFNPSLLAVKAESVFLVVLGVKLSAWGFFSR